MRRNQNDAIVRNDKASLQVTTSNSFSVVKVRERNGIFQEWYQPSKNRLARFFSNCEVDLNS